tara:strand:+ start:47 stop:784 length:738 start_codon:yes stop_codon:yes gene_type:complete
MNFYFLKFNQDKFEGLIITILLIILIIIVGIWYQFIQKPKEKKEFNKWLVEKESILHLKPEIKNILNQLGKQITPCSKCNNTIFQIWNINNSLILRCCNCKKKANHNVDSISDIKTIFDLYTSLYNELNSTQNSLIKEYLKNYLEWDFDSIRKGTSIYSVFRVISLRELIIEEVEYDSTSKSRRISQKVKNQVWNRDNGKCIECGSNEKLEFDHIIPFSKGGSNTYRNIQLLCENCNRVKSNKIG